MRGVELRVSTIARSLQHSNRLCIQSNGCNWSRGSHRGDCRSCSFHGHWKPCNKGLKSFSQDANLIMENFAPCIGDLLTFRNRSHLRHHLSTIQGWGLSPQAWDPWSSIHGVISHDVDLKSTRSRSNLSSLESNVVNSTGILVDYKGSTIINREQSLGVI